MQIFRRAGVDRGAADVEALDLVAADALQDLVQDAGEQHRVDDVAADLRVSVCSGVEAMAPRCGSRVLADGRLSHARA